MTGKSDFTPEEWQLLLEGPPSAGLLVVMAQRGGTFRETFAIAKTYTEARQQHGASELLDAIVAEKPSDHTRYHSADELKDHVLPRLTDAVGLLERKATSEDAGAYKGFILALADKVANAHRKRTKSVSDAEQAAIEEISASLAAPPGTRSARAAPPRERPGQTPSSRPTLINA